jgi:hypothetical protein
VGQPTFTDKIQCFGIYLHGNIHGDIEGILSCQNFLADAFSLLCEPIGNVGEECLMPHRLEASVFIKTVF